MCAALRSRRIDHRSLFVSSDRLARTTSAFLGSRLVGVFGRGLRLDCFGTATAFLHRSFDFVFGIGGHRLARTAPSLLRGRSLDLVDFFDLLLSRERLARTASSLLRSDFDFGVIFGVGNRSGLLRAAATFLWGSIFGAGSCSLLALLGGGLLCLVIVFVGSLGLGGTTTFLASGLLRLVSIFAVL